MSDQVFGSGESFSVQDLIKEQIAQAPAVEGQPDNDTDPEDPGQPVESAPDAEQPATQEPEPAKTTGDGEQLLAGRFKTEGALFKGATEISNFLGEEVDFSEMSTQEIADYYTEARKRLSQRGSGSEGKLGDPSIIVEKLNQLIELQSMQSKKPAESTKPPEAPKPEVKSMSDEEFEEMFYETPAKAMRMMLNSFFAEKQKQQQQPAQAPTPQPSQPEVDWEPIVARVEDMIETHGDGDFDTYRPAIAKLIEQNPAKYLPDREHGIIRAYQDAKALAASKGQLKQITADRQNATQKIEKSKQTATIETGRSSREPEKKLSREDELLNRICNEKPKKGIWG